MNKRLGDGLEWAAAQARRVIHDNDVERLKQLLAEYPALLSWHDDRMAAACWECDGRLWRCLRAEREKSFHPRGVRRVADRCRRDCDAVGVRTAFSSLAREGCCSCFSGRPASAHAQVLFALGDLDAVRARSTRTETIWRRSTKRSVIACSFHHEAVASLLLGGPSRWIRSSAHASMTASDAFLHTFFIEGNRWTGRPTKRTVEGICHGAGHPRDPR